MFFPIINPNPIILIAISIVYKYKKIQSINSLVGVVVSSVGLSNANTIELATIINKATASKIQLVIMHLQIYEINLKNKIIKITFAYI